MSENQILSKLKTVEKNGNINDVDFLCDCLLSENSKISKNSFNILINIKVKSANKIIIEKIKQKKYKKALNLLVSICWQSGLDFSDNLLLFYNIAINEELPISIEALSVIENILCNQNIDEKIILEGLQIFKTYVKTTENNVKTLMISNFIDNC